MNITNLILIIISVLLPSLFLIRLIKQHKNSTNKKGFKNFLYNNSWELFAIFSLMIGFILRLYKIGQVPLGFNQDEASIGYDAFSIMNYGIDRNGISMPVHLVSWGSGQNALYAYLCMPFIKLFGLTELAIRLPMAIIGCLSLLILYKILKTYGKSDFTAVGIFLFAIMPWHIIKSRWGLESNIFPDLILFAVLLIILGLDGKKFFLCVGFVVLGLSAYAYGTSYFFLPVFTLLLFIYLIYQKKIKLGQASAGLGIIIIVSLPIILFVLINKFGWESIETPFFTIPGLTEARQASILNLEGNLFIAIFNNLKDGFSLLLIQTDSLPWNSIAFYGTHYVISLPFLAIGIFAMFRKKGFKYDFIFFIWMIASLLMMFIMSANINRINIIFIPMLYFVALGVYTLITSVKKSWIPVFSVYVIVAVMFVFTYFGSYQDSISRYFFYGLGDAIEYSEELSADRIIVSNRINEPYIFELFYNRTDPNLYIASVVKTNPGAAFEAVSGFDKYVFKEINLNNMENNTIYIVETYLTDVLKSLYPNARIYIFDNYSVVVILADN